MMEVQTFLDAQTSGRNPHLKIIPLFFRLPCKDFKAQALNWVQKWKEWAISDDRINVVKWKYAVQKLKRIKEQLVLEKVPDSLVCMEYLDQGRLHSAKYYIPTETFNDRSYHIQLGVGFSIVELQKKVLTELTQASNEWLEELTDSDIDKAMVATSDYGEYHLMVKKLLVKNLLGLTALRQRNRRMLRERMLQNLIDNIYSIINGHTGCGEEINVRQIFITELFPFAMKEIFNQDVESIYVEGMGRKLSKWEVYDIFMFDFLKWGIEVDWQDFFPYLKWVPFKRFEESLSRVDRRRDAAVKALVQEQKQLLASGKSNCYLDILLEEVKQLTAEQLQMSIWEPILETSDTTHHYRMGHTSVLGRPPVLTIPLIFSTAIMSCITGIHAIVKKHLEIELCELERDLPDVEGDRLYGIKSLSISLDRTLVFWTCVFILHAMYSVAMVVGVTSSFVWTKVATTSGSHLGFRASEGLTVKMVLGT
eukprot:Gb_20775 [translate_table: standard]